MFFFGDFKSKGHSCIIKKKYTLEETVVTVIYIGNKEIMAPADTLSLVKLMTDAVTLVLIFGEKKTEALIVLFNLYKTIENNQSKYQALGHYVR